AHVLRRSIVVEIVDPVEVGRNGALAGPHPREELGLRHPERLPGAGVEAALVRHLVVRAAERLGAAAVADGAGGPDAVLVPGSRHLPLRRDRARGLVASAEDVASEVA